MANSETETSSLTLEASLTRIHNESNLQTEHTSRHSKSGLLIDGPLLSPYIPTPPSKRPPISWIWKQGQGSGEAITRKSDNKPFWLCGYCIRKERQPILVIYSTDSTTPAIRHLVKEHGFNPDGSKVERKRKSDNQGALPAAVQRQIEAASTQLNRDGWRDCYLAWSISDDVSLSKASSKRLRRLLQYHNPAVKELLPKSRRTVRTWKLNTFKQFKPVVASNLQAAVSRISISFDGWKSGNGLSLLGVIAHYIDADYNVKNVLLALRNTYGLSTAEQISHHLLAVIKEYRISTKLNYFMADSANSNDAALRLLQSELSIDVPKQRLRCCCHIINLVCKAILYGCDIDCIEEALSNNDITGNVSQFEAILRGQDSLKALQAWRKKGPIGKLHNIVIHALSSPVRTEYFKSKQREAYGDSERLYHLVINGGIKWNSTCDMLERAFKLQDALNLYQTQFNQELAEDQLSTNDWLELSDIRALLQPLKEVSLALQSDGTYCCHGSLYESLTGIDYLMTKLEDLKQQHLHLPDSHFKASINLGWQKLNKYYTLSDQTPAYRAAIVVHPSKKMKWFESKWFKSHPQWITNAKEAVTSLYNEYKRRHADEALVLSEPGKELTEFERYNLLEDDYDNNDDLDRYLREERTPKDTDPLAWWRLNRHRYPILCHMAFDLLGTPASSSADERSFSKADWTLNKERYNTKDDLAEANQCVKSWIEEEIVYKTSHKKGRRSSSSGSNYTPFGSGSEVEG